MDNKQYYVKLPVWKKCAFGSIDTANNFSWSYISSFLAFYLTDTFLVPAGYVSLMFLICRLWDAIEYSELITKGERMDGFLNTLSSFWNKVGITIGTAGTPLLLELTGYVPNAAQQTAGVVMALDLMKWIMPAAFSVLAMICLIWYRLDYATFDKLVAELNEKRPIWEAERKAGTKH